MALVVCKKENRHDDLKQKQNERQKQKQKRKRMQQTLRHIPISSQRINSRTLNSSIKYHIFRRLLLFLAVVLRIIIFIVFGCILCLFEYLLAIIYLLTLINRIDKSFYYVYTFIIPFAVFPSHFKLILKYDWCFFSPLHVLRLCALSGTFGISLTHWDGCTSIFMMETVCKYILCF